MIDMRVAAIAADIKDRRDSANKATGTLRDNPFITIPLENVEYIMAYGRDLVQIAEASRRAELDAVKKSNELSLEIQKQEMLVREFTNLWRAAKEESEGWREYCAVLKVETV